MRFSLFSATIILSLCGCSDFERAQAPSSPAIEDHWRSDERVQSTDQRWLFTRPLNGLTSREHYVLDFQFLEDRGRLVLHSHFNGYEWRDGVRIEFIRDGEKIALNVSAPGQALVSEILPASFMNSNGRLKMRVEVHNTTDLGFRLIIWKYNWRPDGDIESARPFISAGNSDFDSKARGSIFTGRGRGARWGIEFEKIDVISARREAFYAN